MSRDQSFNPPADMLCRALSVDESTARRLLAEMQRTGVVGAASDAGWHQVRS